MMLRGFTLKPRGSLSLFAPPTQPPLRFGDDAEDLLSNRRMIKKPRFLMRGDSVAYFKCGASGIQSLDEHAFPGCNQSKLLLILKRTHGCQRTEMMMEG